MSENKVLKGQILKCPECKTKIMETKKDMVHYERPCRGDFICLNGTIITDNDILQCGKCYLCIDVGSYVFIMENWGNPND